RCWCWTGRAHTKHVNKASDCLLVPLAGGLHAGDEEATFVLVSNYRAPSWKLNCPSKNVYCFSKQPSARIQNLHPTNPSIPISLPGQVNLVDGVERHRGGTSSTLLDDRYQGSYWFARGDHKLPKEGWRVKIGKGDQVLVRCCVVGHTRGDHGTRKDVTDDKRI